MIIKTNLKPVDYELKDICRIVNPKQQYLYIKNNAYPIDMYTSKNPEGKDLLVMIFKKSDTSELYERWKNYAL